MIYKPTTVVPNLETVSIPSSQDSINFYLTGMSGSKISSKIRMGFNGGAGFEGSSSLYTGTNYKDTDGNYYYEKEGVDVAYNNDSYFLNWSMSMSDYHIVKNVPIGWCARLYESDSYNDDKTDYPFKKGWRCGTFNYNVAYQEAGLSAEKKTYKDSFYYCTDYIPSSWIGYGSVGEFSSSVYLTGTKSSNASVISSSSKNGKSDKYYMLKIFPHDFHNQNMFGNDTKSYSNTKQYTSGYDSYYARYYIKLKGYYFKILDWRYYDWRDNTKTPIKNLEGNVDGYGNALSMYVLIKVPSGFSLSSNEDLTYTIYSNYIDTDNYSLEINDEPTLSFCDSKFPDVAIPFYDTKEDALDNEYQIAYSDFDLQAVYSQNSGAYLSKYSINIDKIKEDGSLYELERVHDRFAQTLKYSYSDFMNGEKYLLSVRITNNRGVTDERYLCIAPQYGIEPRFIQAKTKYNKVNNSVKIDFSEAFSIAAKEAVEGEHEFLTEQDLTYVHLQDKNSITYDEIDGVGALSFKDFTASIVIRFKHDFSGELVYIEDDDGNEYQLSWDGIRFTYNILQKNGSIKQFNYTPYADTISAETDITKNAWLAKMMNNLKVSEENKSVPYIWNMAFDAQKWDDTLYWHEEEPYSENWWSIILRNDGASFANLTTGETAFHEATGSSLTAIMIQNPITGESSNLVLEDGSVIVLEEK